MYLQQNRYRLTRYVITTSKPVHTHTLTHLPPGLWVSSVWGHTGTSDWDK